MSVYLIFSFIIFKKKILRKKTNEMDLHPFILLHIPLIRIP